MVADKNSSLLIVGISEKCPNLYYATHFLAPDSFVFLQIRGRKIMFASDLEVDRAKKEADVDEVISLSRLSAQVRQRTGGEPNMIDLVDYFLRQKKVNHLAVPCDFPLVYADALRKRGFKLACKAEPFFEQRLCKTAREIAHITRTLRCTELAIQAAEQALRESTIARGRLIHEGKSLTSEDLKRIINVKLMEHNIVSERPIVAGGRDCLDPHCEGRGLLRPNTSIILDVYPTAADSRYCADISRTFVKGRASAKLKRMYEAVRAAQEIAFERIREGADGSKIHGAILDYFEREGFQSGSIGGRMQGFFHGTGHGVGLEVHEPPRIGRVQNILKAGQVVTVEPGLYYADAGGVRLEDLVVVEKSGMRNLTRYPRVLEIE